ncbi:hypothetical protein BASA81_001570 [Batrachochytrium salamandrivorans]|nr:hypothetical protein BASA81_001570 [Batrachochytrium salamandrivorans]
MDGVFDLVMGVIDRSVMVLGPILLLGGWSLVLFVSFVFFREPFFSMQTDGVAVMLIGNLFGLWLLFNIMFNWYMGFKTDPGRAPLVLSKPNHGEEEENAFCQKCDCVKPTKAHHCHVCKRCVLGFDHHCPWFNNCIGFFNYRYFISTLFYLLVGCLYVFLLAVGKLGVHNRRREAPQAFFVLVLSLSVSFAVGVLLAWHLYLVLSGQATIDFYQRRMERDDTSAARATLLRRKRKKMSVFYWMCLRQKPALPRNDFDLGPERNWERVFGTKSVIRSLLPSFRPPAGDGVHWQTCKSLISRPALSNDVNMV